MLQEKTTTTMAHLSQLYTSNQRNCFVFSTCNENKQQEFAGKKNIFSYQNFNLIFMPLVIYLSKKYAFLYQWWNDCALSLKRFLFS